ncbi:MAG: DUF3108 domain-containing protein [Bacteroides sp.]|nr:DUF3108 domain-containing protein [Bacteroides sp.]
MKKLLLFFAALLPSLAASAQVSIPYQEIPYDVHYHWGLIDVMIAHGRATIQSDGQNFSATLDGNSIPWEGRVFCVSDTLNALMTPQASGPAREKVTYQNGWYLKPKVTVFNSGNFHPDDPVNYRNIHGQGALDASGETMEAITVTSDMLALFYYFREIDFSAMQPGQQLTIPIEGGFARSVTLTYGGIQDGNYAVDFQYTYNGAPSGYTVSCQVEPATGIPVTMSASLPVGHVTLLRAN